jgi:hypothetical protein
MNDDVERDDPASSARRLALEVVITAAFALLALLLASTRPPQSDEGHFANAAASIARDGRFVMPMWTAWIPTLDVRVYSNMPMYFLALAAWFKVTGVGWIAMRSLSVIFGVMLLWSVRSVVGSITQRREAQTLAVLIVGLNYDIINFASARYDIMTAALGMAALAVYLWQRERSLNRAVLLSNSLLAVACMTHPYAIFGMVGVGIFALCLDGSKLTLRCVAFATLPYVVVLAAWGTYILVDPEMFRAQFGANARGRASGTMNPVVVLRDEFQLRYLQRFAGWGRDNVPVAMRAKVFVLLSYIAGVAGIMAWPSLRRNRAALSLSIYTIVVATLLAFFERNRWYIYLVYELPLLAACLTVCASEMMRVGKAARVVALGAAAGLATFSIVSVLYRARVDAHHRAYLPAAEYLRARVQPGDFVEAGGEFGVALNFEEHVRDDSWLNPRNGRRPDFVVQSSYGSNGLAIQPSLENYPPLVRERLAGYAQVFSSEAGGVRYVILAPSR